MDLRYNLEVEIRLVDKLWILLVRNQKFWLACVKLVMSVRSAGEVK